MKSDFDAIVIGAGPSGSSTALGLADQNMSVAVIERSTFPRRKVCGEFVSAVNLDVLDQLCVGQQFRERAGPEVRRVGYFAAGPATAAPMPRAGQEAFGRALGRDILDTMLLDAARQRGIGLFQPFRATRITKRDHGSIVEIESRRRSLAISAPVIVAAHGSWEPGRLVTNLAKQNRPGDLLGFKAHCHGANLPRDMMPLLVFPGGYGGMVWADRNRLSISCCIRRDMLQELRKRHRAMSAAEAVHRHIIASCPAVAEVLADASLDGAWLAAGPIRPGIRAGYQDDIFRVGNLAGESHPIIAEGISMALQSGWMLARELGRSEICNHADRAVAGDRYSMAWRRQFRTRIRGAELLSRLVSLPGAAATVSAVVRIFPPTLSVGAAISGKTRRIPGL